MLVVKPQSCRLWDDSLLIPAFEAAARTLGKWPVSGNVKNKKVGSALAEVQAKARVPSGCQGSSAASAVATQLYWPPDAIKQGILHDYPKHYINPSLVA
jgi:hypothetical protein